MKALEKDRSRRYESATSFAADIRRHLSDEPVLACPPSAWYRVRKLTRRNKAAVAISSALAAAALAMIGVLTVSNVRISRALVDRESALTAAKTSKRETRERLAESLHSQARAIRVGRRPGQRFKSLDVLQRATELAHTLALPGEKFDDLRNDAIAALALPDLFPDGQWHPFPADACAADFDDAHAFYARTDRRGDCSVRRVLDDAEVHLLPGLGVQADPHLRRDGRYVAVSHAINGPGGRIVALQLWELGPSSARRILSEEGARGASFHPSLPQVALAYADGSIGLFELPSGREIRRMPPVVLTREIRIALHPTEPIVAVSSYFGSEVQLRDLDSGLVRAALPQMPRVTCLAWHPDGRALAVGSDGGPIRLYDRGTLRLSRTLATKQTSTCISFNPAGDRLAATGWWNVLELFDACTGRKVFETEARVTGLRFSRDGRKLAGAIRDGKLGRWQVGDAREYRTLARQDLPEHVNFTSSVTVSPDGRLAAAFMSDGIGLWDLPSGRELAFVPVADGGHTRALFEPSGALLALCAAGLYRWPVVADPVDRDRLIVGPPVRLPLPCGSVLDRSNDGRVIATCSPAAGVEEPHAGGWILHADRPEGPIRIDAGADIGWIAVSPDGRRAVTVDHASGMSKIWDTRDGRMVKRLAGWGTGMPRFSPDGLWLATDLDGGRLFEVGTWRPGPRVGGAGTFSPDGRVVAVPRDGMIELVDPATGRRLATLEDPDLDSGLSPVFTPDGTQLLVNPSGKVKVIRIWDLRLVRRHLAGMGLDWEAPPYASSDPGREATPPLTVDVRLGDLAPPALAAEEKSRQAIEHYRLALERHPDDAEACNGLAWVYLNATEAIRDVKAGVSLAEKAVRLDPASGSYRNTLGVAYFRDGRDREAAEILRANLDKQKGCAVAFDLYFLAMCHQRLGEIARARDSFDWAVRWAAAQNCQSPEHIEELNTFRSEASQLLGVERNSRVELPARLPGPK